MESKRLLLTGCEVSCLGESGLLECLLSMEEWQNCIRRLGYEQALWEVGEYLLQHKIYFVNNPIMAVDNVAQALLKGRMPC